MEWEQDATEMMRAYLGQVRDAAIARGADGNAVANNVQQRLVGQLKGSGAATITADLVRGVLASAGSPDAVAAAVTPPPMPPMGAAATPPPFTAGGAVSPVQRPAKSSKAFVTCLIVACVGAGMLVLVGMLAAILLPALARAREAARRASCQNNLKQVHLICAMYANNHQKQYPLPSISEESFMFDPSVMTGFSLDLLQCPSDPSGDLVAGPDYIYLGYAVRSQEEAEAVVLRYMQVYNTSMTHVELPDFVDGPAGRIDRLQEGMPGADQIPVLIDWGSFHLPDGGNVIYLDGHTEFVRMNAKFPMTEAFFALISRARM